MAQEFSYNDDLYLIDMSYLNSPSELVYDLTSVLDNEQAKNRRIKIKIGGIELNQAQLMSINSLIMSINSSLVVLDGTSEITRASALASGIVYENSADMVPSETAFINEIPSEDNTEEKSCETFSDESEQTCEKPQEEDYDNNFVNEGNPSENNENQNYENNSDNPEPEYNSGENENNYTEENQQEENHNFVNEGNPSENNENQNYENNNDNSEPEYNSGENENNQTEETFFENTESIISGVADSSEVPTEEKEIVVKNYSGINEQSAIPESSVIQEELSLIYGTEKKLEDVFESTGIREEKFVSFREAATAEEREYTKFDFELEAFPTKYLKQNICAGQVISFDGNLVIIGDCHEGSEISASGDITVWGDLSGSAYAGMNGNEKAKIRALRMNASQLRISTCFIKRPEVLENPNGQKLPLIPEEAGIVKGEIGVYKIFK